MPEQIIYQSTGPKEGEIWVLRREEVPKESLKLKAHLGKFLLVGGMLSLFFFISPYLFLEIKWWLNQKTGSQKTGGSPPKSGFTKVVQKSDLEILQPADPQFSVVIPKIDINSLVVANVSPGDESQFRLALKKGVAHAAGSFLPGQNGTVYIFGHSTDYPWNIAQFNAVFYLLKELEVGDQVNLFYQGKRYVYQVTRKEITGGDSLQYLEAKKGQEEVILQTCWPPGTTWQRLLVIATPQEEWHLTSENL